MLLCAGPRVLANDDVTTPESPSVASDSNTDLIDLRDWVADVLWPRRRLIFAVTAATAAIAFTVAALWPKAYESRASIVIVATPAEMEIDYRIATSTKLRDAVLAEARQLLPVSAAAAPVLLADRTYYSSPNAVLTLVVRAPQPDVAEKVAEIWGRKFIDVMREEREGALEQLRSRAAMTAKENDAVTRQTDQVFSDIAKARALVTRKLNRDGIEEHVSLLTQQIASMTIRLDQLRLAREVSTVEAKLLGVQAPEGEQTEQVPRAKLPQAPETVDRMRAIQIEQQKQDADIAATEAALRRLTSQRDDAKAQLAVVSSRLDDADLVFSRRRSQAQTDADRAFRAMSEAKNELAAAEAALTSAPQPRLAAVEPPHSAATAKYFLAAVATALAFALMIVVTTLKRPAVDA